MTDPALDLVTDHDLLSAYAGLEGWEAVTAAGAVPPVAPSVVEDAVAFVAAEAAVDALVAQRTSPWRGARRRTLVAAGLVAAVAAGALVLPSALRSPSASAAAASLLTRAADSIHASDPVAAPGQWWRITTTGVDAASGPTPSGALGTWLVGRTVVSYLAVDGSRPTITVGSAGTLDRQVAGPAGSAPPDGTLAAGSTEAIDLAPDRLPGTWQTGTPAFLAALPRDPQALRARLYADTAGEGPSADGEAFTAVADLLRTGLVPADLRAALFRVLATIPGVGITSATASLDGATGVGIGRLEDRNGLRQEIIVSPSDGALVGERTVAVRAVDGIAAGTVLDSRRSSRALVDSVPADVLARVHVAHCTVGADGGVGCTG